MSTLRWPRLGGAHDTVTRLPRGLEYVLIAKTVRRSQYPNARREPLFKHLPRYTEFLSQAQGIQRSQGDVIVGVRPKTHSCTVHLSHHLPGEKSIGAKA